MELSKQIKRYRMQRGLSQEDLAGKIYVSRQTVSNWETDKTYPDVQSLLLLSVLFDVTIDELIKGDMEAMKEAVEHDGKKLNALGLVMLAFAL
ncbi:MAG: helix-turn-helix transcriptional regulator, partial [Paraeggerthella sp.]|nr:helix-turn-helix transcriptional regulator [Paraeggerthella sp.]